MEKKEKTGKIVAITGSICSGKSTILKEFGALGAPLLSCDEEIKKIKAKNKNVQKRILEEFSLASLDSSNLAEIVFCDSQKMRLLEKILYPELDKKVKKFFEDNKERIAFVEIPLLYEKKKEALYDKVIVASCSKEAQKQRAINRGLSVVMLEKILETQLSDQEKISRADYEINTETSVGELKNRIKKIYEEIKEEG